MRVGGDGGRRHATIAEALTDVVIYREQTLLAQRSMRWRTRRPPRLITYHDCVDRIMFRVVCLKDPPSVLRATSSVPRATSARRGTKLLLRLHVVALVRWCAYMRVGMASTRCHRDRAGKEQMQIYASLAEPSRSFGFCQSSFTKFFNNLSTKNMMTPEQFSENFHPEGGGGGKGTPCPKIFQMAR